VSGVFDGGVDSQHVGKCYPFFLSVFRFAVHGATKIRWRRRCRHRSAEVASVNADRSVGPTRRAFLGAAAATAGLAAAGSASAQEGGVDFGGWFDDVDNYDGVVDARGQSEVTVDVGAQGNGGAFAFGPAAIRVDPGTTVVFEWTGEGGQHNVVTEEGVSLESELTDEAGFTFEHTFQEEGVTTYYCEPHRSLGMKGAVVVGDQGAGPVQLGEPDYGDWFADVENYEETVDRRGQSEVTVEVGAQGNGGAFAFEPAAVRVDPGTTVVFEWTGEGGQHNVVSEDGESFESELTEQAGFTFEHTFEEEGVTTYFCEPHRSLGMKGAVAVGNVGGPAAEEGGVDEAFANRVFGAFGAVLGLLTLPVVAGLLYIYVNRRSYQRPDEGPAVEAEGTGEGTVRKLTHDEYDPVGTAALVAFYFVLVSLLWVFMYFVEFLGNGPTVIG
jgi:halocyanin-like protein